jgi:exonuclease SbcC
MKILAIRLKNLASLAGPIEIDFTAEPLASTGLFAITGATGAGKSTLLDALCLALFGSVPRLGNLKRETKVPDLDGEIPTDDPRTLLRRGTGSGYAEVDFVGIDGRRYRARWEANRAREKATGKLQLSKQSLHDIDGGQVLTSQKREFEQLIELRLGLNFEQFTRAVMLAQSEFSAFLKADDKDRSELLEKLTNTAIYSQLGRRAFSKARDAQDAHRQLQQEASGTQPLSAEAREALDQAFASAQQALQGHQAQLKQLELQRQWLHEYQRLQAQLLEAELQQRQAQQHWDGLAPQRLELGRLEQLAPQRHVFARQQAVLGQLTPLATQLQRMRERQASLASEQGQLDAEREAASQTSNLARIALADAAPALQQAFAAERDLARLQSETTALQAQVDSGREQLGSAQQTLASLRERQQHSLDTLQQLQAELDKSSLLAPLADAWPAWRDRLQAYLQVCNRLAKGQAELQPLQDRASAASASLAGQRETLEVLYREADTEPDAVAEQVQILANLLQDNRKQHRAFEEMTRLWTSLQALEKQRATLQAQQGETQQQREQLTREGLQTKQDLQVAEQTLSVTRALLERQRLARSASVENLREQLQNDQPCPVCGSVEHPWHQPEALLQDLAVHDEQEGATAQQAVDALKEKVVELRERVGAVISRQKEQLQQQEQLHQQRETLLPSLQQHSLGAALFDQAEAARDAWLSKQLAQLEQQVRQDETRQNALLTLQQDAARLQQELRAATQASQAASEQLASQRHQLKADQARRDEELQALAGLLPAELLEPLREDAAKAFVQLDRQVGERLASLERRQEEQTEQLQRQQQLDKLHIQQQAAEAQQQGLQARLDDQASQRDGVQQQLQGLLADHASAEAWQHALQEQLDQAQATQAELDKRQQDSERQALQLATELKGGDERLLGLQQEHDSLAGDIGQWRQRHPELDDEGLETLLRVDDAELQQRRQLLQTSEQAVQHSQVLAGERQQRLQAHADARDPAQWAAEQMAAEPVALGPQLDSALAHSQGELQASEQQSAELRAAQVADQRRQEANHALAERINAAHAEYQRWGRISTLIGSASGDTFRKIAQAYNLDLLVHHANAQLRQLARRYRLKRGGSMLGLLVLDTEMGDELRSVHSLSGGETFLVSLALALGLASMASSTLKIESLFIDEGFGSLDPESLQLAMDALDGLQAQGRKVGVISHVQEMHERIPVQIRVQRQGNGLSTVEVG